ncbi:aldo/keto reductase [Flavobacterium sp. 5]|uniref:aldo/keto reductase n=1 Tax=Flavobacterium sp. 5 TaxID=2035199 RepID=UPI000C2C753C|nr:aldo/keto reductase [Flavobacterium sp. 5]PKB18774.1 aryl-alcohol dehydrogenase-like predicted oxidoreductase [Flavobacterium sp. 5]
MKKTITIGAGTNNPITINRFGYGTMRLPGDFVWGKPKNREEALEILRTAANKGINFLDTADFYGDDITNRLIKEALYPYNDETLICTKVGAARTPDKAWVVFNTPENLRTSIERNLKTLKLEQLPLVHFRVMPNTATPFKESLQAMFDMQKEGKILHIGLSNVSPEELKIGLTMGSIVSVENAFGYGQRTSFESHGQQTRGLQEVMPLCIANNIMMVPFWSLQNSLPKNDDKIAVIAKKYKVSTAQINIAWLLHFNDLILPIPGTSQLKHFEENIAACDILLTEEDMAFLG